jgi:hypothetical protein
MGFLPEKNCNLLNERMMRGMHLTGSGHPGWEPQYDVLSTDSLQGAAKSIVGANIVATGGTANSNLRAVDSTIAAGNTANLAAATRSPWRPAGTRGNSTAATQQRCEHRHRQPARSRQPGSRSRTASASMPACAYRRSATA